MKNENGFYWEPSPRWVRVQFAGEFIADSRNVVLVWEGGGPRLHYHFPREDVRPEFLVETGRGGKERKSWHVQVGGQQADNAAWSYPDPIPEAPKIKELLSFYNEKVDIFVDGVKEKRPITAWSK